MHCQKRTKWNSGNIQGEGEQYKELKIFQGLCSEKNQSQQKKISLHYAIFTIQNYRVFDNFERRTEVQESGCLKM